MCEGFNSLSVTERIRAMYSFHSCHLSHPFKGLILAHSIHARHARSDAGNAEQVSLIRGAEKGCYLVTEMGGHKGDNTIWK